MRLLIVVGKSTQSREFPDGVCSAHFTEKSDSSLDLSFHRGVLKVEISFWVINRCQARVQRVVLVPSDEQLVVHLLANGAFLLF